MEHILKYGCVVITGHPGAGKSRLGLEILHQYTQQQNEYSNSAVKSSLPAFQDTIDIDDTCIILFDDIFGKTTCTLNEENDLKYVNALTSFVNGQKVKVVITMRESVKNMCISFIKKMQLFRNIVDLESERFKMSRKDRKHCLENYLRFNHIEIVDEHKRLEGHPTVPQSLSSQSINEILEIDEYPCLGFPEACYLFTSNETFLKQGVNFFRHANEGLLGEIRKIKETIDKGKHHFTVLAYTLFNGDKLDLTNINEDHLSSTFHSVFKGDTVCTYFDIRKSVDFLKGYLLKEETGNRFCFQHRSIFEAVFLVVSECQMRLDETIKLMDFDFIIEMTRPEKYNKLKGDVLFVIPSVNYRDLADRIIFHLRNCKDKEPFLFFKRLCESPIIQQSGSEVIKAMLQHEEAIIDIFSGRKYSVKFSERNDQPAVSSSCPFVMPIAFMIYCSDGTLPCLETHITEKLASNSSLRKLYVDASLVSFLICCRICNSIKAKTIWDIFKSEKRNDDMSDQVLVNMHEILKNEKSLTIFVNTVDNHIVLHPNIFLKCLYFKDFNMNNVETIIKKYGQCIIDMDLAMNLACCNGNIELVKYFLIKHKNINFDMISAMNKACGHGNWDLITFLLETVENNKFDMISAMNEACWNGRVEIVESLFNKFGTKAFDMQSAMNKACGNTMGNVKVLKCFNKQL
ncbi:Hypothetical predicted protein [Mytilus galloprovincialis]|uniref:Novel STAND NTPase 3 domain-containing protein n=1 Tax=Mytilus galloprovincialis TaxID=29158 RepID=A0A8B6CWK2_MYTGA|nr:Hypothetical predicted protein [Mytilus galloprovincialis]